MKGRRKKKLSLFVVLSCSIENYIYLLYIMGKRTRRKTTKRKVYGGTKKTKTKKVSKKKMPTRKKKVSKTKKHSVVKTRSTNPWLLYSGPRAESMYPAYFKERELKEASQKRKKVLEDLIKAEETFRKRQPVVPQWTPSRLPPADIEYLFPYGM